MSTPLEIAHPLEPFQMDAQEFNRRVEECIAEHKKSHPGSFSHGTGLIGDNQGVLFDILLALLAPHLTLDEEKRRECLESIEMISALMLAYKTKSFADLRENDHMLVATNASEKIKTKRPQAHSGDGTLAGTFREPFLGEADQLLISALNHYRSLEGHKATKQPYTYSISVIQSSGAGKSRMVDQAANSVFTLPLNIRKHLESGVAFPPSDPEVRNYLMAHKGKSDQEVQAMYAIFLRVLFDKATEKVAAIGGGKTGAELASAWAGYLKEDMDTEGIAPHKQAFLNDVVAESKNQSRGEVALAQLLQVMKQSCNKFVEAVFPNRPRGTNAAFVYFNEADGLAKPIECPTVKRQRTAYHNLGIVLTSLSDCPVFFIFLSTSPVLQWFAPPSAQQLSTPRLRGPYSAPPFTELPSDLFAKKVIQGLADAGKTVSPANVCSTDVMVGFGRALWYVHYKQFLAANNTVDPIFELAWAKLTTCKIYWNRDESDLATLGVRIGITFDMTTSGARQLESHLVESHMRVVYSIPNHREFMYAGSPSEPVLAEGAARHLASRSGRSGIQCLGPEILARACEQGVVAREGRAELCGRLLMTSAHDIAIRRYLGKLGVSSWGRNRPYFHQPVPVLDFICALFADRFHETVLEAKSVSRKDGVPALKDVFAESFVSFSHFALALDYEMMSAPNLALALVRGMALQAVDNQHSIDLVIPIHMGPVTEPISGDTTSAINLQIKNRKHAIACNVVRQLTVPDPKQPVISIIIEFGDDRELVEIQERSHDIARSNEGATDYEDHHYEIVACGRGPGTFNAIPREAEAYYEAVLAMGSASDDFARRESDKHLAAFESMNSEFSSTRCDWIELP